MDDKNIIARLDRIEKMLAANKPVMNIQEAAFYMGITESSLYKLTHKKQVPHSKPNGKLIYFAKDDLDEWMLSNPILTEDEIEAMASTYVSTGHFFTKKRASAKIKKICKPTKIYLMMNKRNGYYKIGASWNPKFREKTLQAEEPEVELVKEWDGEKTNEIQLQQFFADKNIRGEWFNLNEFDIKKIEDYMKVVKNKTA